MKKTIRYIDIHGHVNFPEYDSDREETIARADEAGVGMITVGTDIDSSRRAIELTETHENVWAIVGIHPTEVKSEEAKSKDDNDAPAHNASSAVMQDERRLFRDERSNMRKSALALVGGTGQDFVADLEELRRLASHSKVVAIGECGLDYFHCDPADIPAQVEAFERHIVIANECGKPLMLHVRNGRKKGDMASTGKDAYKDALDILKKSAKVPFDFHFFAGSLQDMEEILVQGGNVSFTGVITFTHDYDELIKAAPLERIMSETDCPYVAPVPYRGKRSEPAHVIEVVKAIARIRSEGEEIVRIALLENARRFFSM